MLAGSLGWVARATKELVVGYIYVGARHDSGYNQSHARAASGLARLAGVKVIEQENVSESEAVATAMEAMIVQEGAKLLFPTSYGYFDPYILKLARRYPEVYFQHCGALWQASDNHPLNVGSYVGHMHEGQHLAGVIAGGMTRTGKIGFIASKRYPGVMRNTNAFTLGVRSIQPEATVQAVFTGSWSDPVREAESVNALADRGADVFGCSVDSASTVMTTVNRRGLHACGYNASLAESSGDAYLTAAISNWLPVNEDAVKRVLANKRPANFFSGGLAEGTVDIDEPGPAVPPQLRQRVAAIRQDLISARKAIWVGPLKNNKGELVIEAGRRLERTDPLLKKMNWFVQGVIA